LRVSLEAFLPICPTASSLQLRSILAFRSSLATAASKPQEFKRFGSEKLTAV